MPRMKWMYYKLPQYRAISMAAINRFICPSWGTTPLRVYCMNKKDFL